jgi:hypothetical protein
VGRHRGVIEPDVVALVAPDAHAFGVQAKAQDLVVIVIDEEVGAWRLEAGLVGFAGDGGCSLCGRWSRASLA